MTPREKLAELVDSDRLVCDAHDVATVLDVRVWSIYDAVKAGNPPIQPIRVGRRIKFRVADLQRLVGAA